MKFKFVTEPDRFVVPCMTCSRIKDFTPYIRCSIMDLVVFTELCQWLAQLYEASCDSEICVVFAVGYAR